MENSFLYQVAEKLYQTYGNKLHNITIVFPSRRARLFFSQHLAQLSSSPIWSPQYTDLSHLYSEISTLKLTEPLELISELWKIYKEKRGDKAESFDEFYFFGELILSDFNDIDKNLVDANKLYQNLSDLKVITDTFGSLDDKQKEIIQKFFNYNEAKNEIKKNFFSVWNILSEIYIDFQKNLKEKNIAYDGLLARNAVEILNKKENQINQILSAEKYVFVGFNILTKCEKELFSILKRNNKALFFWDYDDYYKNDKNQEAGTFIRQNLSSFDQCPGFELKEPDLLSKLENIQILSADTESAQVKYIPEFLREIKSDFSEPNTAIVLCQENLLQPVINAIPNSIEHKNITMGFSLRLTSIYDFIITLLDLKTLGSKKDQNQFYRSYVTPVANHPYAKQWFANKNFTDLKTENQQLPTVEELSNFYNNSVIFQKPTTNEELVKNLIEIIENIRDAKIIESTLEAEALFQIYKQLNQLDELISKNEIIFEKQNILARLIKKMLQSTSIPFHGEPAQGLQVMGILETRNMDFDNVLLLSTNEGNLPKTDCDNSFIPYFIRKAFDMTTIEHQDSLYAYYFYRLLQRAKKVTIMYHNAKGEIGNNERSRFILQLLNDHPCNKNFKIKKLESAISISTNNETSIEKTDEHLKFLLDKYQKESTFSPSAINTFVKCNMAFYYKYVEKIQVIKDEPITGAQIGNIVHRTCEMIYREIGKQPQPTIADKATDIKPFTVSKDQIEIFTKNTNLIDRFIKKAFDIEIFEKETEEKQYNGEQLILKEISKKLIQEILKKDIEKTPFLIKGLEKKVSAKHAVSINGKTEEINLGGYIDRMDSNNGILEIIDYKTTKKDRTKKIEELFNYKDNSSLEISQLFTYSWIVSQQKEYTEKGIAPIIYRIKKFGSSDFFENYETDWNDWQNDFTTKLQDILNEIFDKGKTWKQCDNNSICKYCDYRNVCRKAKK